MFADEFAGNVINHKEKEGFPGGGLRIWDPPYYPFDSSTIHNTTKCPVLVLNFEVFMVKISVFRGFSWDWLGTF